MKWILMILVLWQGVLVAEAMEVRAYLVDAGDLRNVGGSGPGILAFGENASRYEEKVLKEAPFESRFFSEEDELLDYTEWAEGPGIFRKGEGKAVYNEKTGRLVVRAGLGKHYLLKDFLEQYVLWQLN